MLFKAFYLLFILIFSMSCLQNVLSNRLDAKTQAAFVHDENIIRKVQGNLYARGYNTGEINGQLHGDTVDAIKSFQVREGLEITGDINHETLEALELEMIYAE